MEWAYTKFQNLVILKRKQWIQTNYNSSLNPTFCSLHNVTQYKEINKNLLYNIQPRHSNGLERGLDIKIIIIGLKIIFLIYP